MPRRRRSNTIRNLLLFILVAVFLLMGVSPLIEATLPQNSTAAGWLEWSRSRVMETLVAIWFFVFGSMVGSFINVVVWRMPRGVSVVARGSACPWCTSKIRMKDNIPIFGWIKLRGRCRVCRLPISPRYPVVEAIFGFVFLLMFVVELQTTAANLPGGKRYLSTGILQVIISTKWDLILVYVYHMVLLVLLLTWTLMDYDRSRIPVKTIAFAILAGLGLSMAFPYVHPVKWHTIDASWFTDFPWIQRFATGFLGLASGVFAGSIFEGITGNQRSQESNRSGGHTGLTCSLLAIGLFLGWQAVIRVIFLFGAGWLICSLVPRWKWLPASGILTLATIVFLCFWRQLHPLPDHVALAWVQLCLALILGLAMVWGASCPRNRPRPDLETPE